MIVWYIILFCFLETQTFWDFKIASANHKSKAAFVFLTILFMSFHPHVILRRCLGYDSPQDTAEMNFMSPTISHSKIWFKPICT